METTSTTLAGRSSGWRLAVLGIGAVLTVLLLILVFGPSSDVQAASTTWTAELDSGRHSNGREYGYGYGFGTLTPDSFQHNGTTYTVDYLKWDLRDREVEFGLDNCLDPSLFTSLQIGSTTYSDPDYIRQETSECTDNPTWNQEFEFHDLSSNPLTAGTQYQVTLTLGGGTTTTTTSSSCVTSIGTVSGYLERDDETWVSSCKSVSRTGRYAKFYTFSLAQMADVQIDVIATFEQDPYLYLLRGASTTGAVIEYDDDDRPVINSYDSSRNSRITRQLLPGMYTIEATTYAQRVGGEFRIDMTVSPMAAERVASTTVQFGQSLTSPKGLAWDGTALYMVDDGTDALYTVTTSTGIATRVGTTTRFGLSDTDVQPRGLSWDGSTLYMLTPDKVYTLDRTSGVATLVGRFAGHVTNGAGLAWWLSPTATSTGVTGQAPGRLYMVDSVTDLLYIVNTAASSTDPAVATAVDSSVLQFGLNIGSPVGLVWVGPDLYMTSGSPRTLYRVDEASGRAINLGAFGITSPTDLAWDGSRLYVLDDSTNALYTIPDIGLPDPPRARTGYQTKQLGSATQFGLTDVTLDEPRGLTMAGQDLYMVEDDTDFLYTVNRMTGVATKVGTSGLSSSAIEPRDIAWNGTTLYMATRNALYTVDTSTGVATRRGPFGTRITDAYGLAWDGEKLYMVDRNTDALYTVATSTGAATRVNVNAIRFNSNVTNPSALVWVGPPVSEVEDDNEMPSLYMGNGYGHLYKLDKDTGHVSSHMGRPSRVQMSGLAWFDETSTLYFADDTSDALHTVTNFPGFLPNAGDLYYNGSNFADGFVRWDNPSWVQSAQCQTDPLKCSTYEHDLTLEWKASGGWFDYTRSGETGRYPFNPFTAPFCTAWSDLPMGFDACPTAGVLAAPDLVELSFGTFKASLIEGGHDYYGFWVFKNQRGAGSTTEVKLYGQEGKYGRGRWENIHCYPVRAEWAWCVEGRQQASMLESGTTWSYGTSSYITYSRP